MKKTTWFACGLFASLGACAGCDAYGIVSKYLINKIRHILEKKEKKNG